MTIKCVMCGFEFDDGHPEKFNGKHKMYCADCKKIAALNSKRTKTSLERAERRRMLVEKREKPFLDDVRAADAMGMTYGAYKEWLKRQKEQEAKDA